MTHADKIREMSDDELKNLLEKVRFCGALLEREESSLQCRTCSDGFCCDIGRWLQSPAPKELLSPIEIANYWRSMVGIYNITTTETPKTTLECMIKAFGFNVVEEVFATISAIKKKDGRIYGKNRLYMDSISVNPEAIKRESDNPVIHAGLDEIHPTHINQLITELRYVKEDM